MTSPDDKEPPTTNIDEPVDMRTDRFTWHLEDVEIYNSVDEIPNFHLLSDENQQQQAMIEDEIMEAKTPKFEDAIQRYYSKFKATRSISDSDL